MWDATSNNWLGNESTRTSWSTNSPAETEFEGRKMKMNSKIVPDYYNDHIHDNLELQIEHSNGAA
jgi:hypothetical protein